MSIGSDYSENNFNYNSEQLLIVENLGSDVSRKTYPDGRVEEFRHQGSSDFGKRSYPNGRIEYGKFIWGERLYEGKIVLPSGEVLYKDKIETLTKDQGNGPFIGFLNYDFSDEELLKDETVIHRLRVFEKVRDNIYHDYSEKIYKELNNEKLNDVFISNLITASEHNLHVSDLKKILDGLPDFSEFLEMLQKPEDNPSIFLLNFEICITILRYACERGVKFDINLINPKDNSKLGDILQYTNSEQDLISIIKNQPTILFLSRDWKRPLVLSCAKMNFSKLAAKVLKNLEKLNIPKIEIEDIVQRILNNNFETQWFSNLNSDLKKKSYMASNGLANLKFVQKIKENIEPNLIPKASSLPPGPAIIHDQMDAAEIVDSVTSYFEKLRTEKRILNKQEFELLDMEKFEDASSKWRKKGKYIERLLGADHINKSIENLGVKTVKVPLKIAVVKSKAFNDSVLKVRTCKTGISNLQSGALLIMSDDLKVYAEVIRWSDRKLTREEMTDLYKVLYASNYSDTTPLNFIIAEDAIYIVDTEFDSLNGYKGMSSLKCFLNESDHEWFNEQIIRESPKSVTNVVKPATDDEKKQRIERWQLTTMTVNPNKEYAIPIKF